MYVFTLFKAALRSRKRCSCTTRRRSSREKTALGEQLLLPRTDEGDVRDRLMHTASTPSLRDLVIVEGYSCRGVSRYEGAAGVLQS